MLPLHYSPGIRLKPKAAAVVRQENDRRAPLGSQVDNAYPVTVDGPAKALVKSIPSAQVDAW